MNGFTPWPLDPFKITVDENTNVIRFIQHCSYNRRLFLLKST